jgi:hypothetical protein
MSFTIYKIYLKDNPELFYIGSTNNYRTRKNRHKSQTKTCKSFLHRTIRKHGGFDNIVFEKLEDYKYTFNMFDEHLEQLFIEEIWVRHLQPTLNTRKPCKINWKTYFKI